MAELFKFLIDSPEAVILLIYLLLPGYLATKFYDLLAPGERQGFAEEMIDIVAWSFILLLFWFWPIAALYEFGDSLSLRNHYLALFVITILSVFVTPVLGAYLVFRVRHRGFLRDAAKAGLPIRPPHLGTGSSQSKPTTTTCGFISKQENLGGYYGENSFATSFPNKQEIFVEEAWHLDEDGKFTERVEGTKGAVVSREDCTLVEFLEVREPAGTQDGHNPMAEDPNTERMIRGEGYQSGKPNSPSRTPPWREHH